MGVTTPRDLYQATVEGTFSKGERKDSWLLHRTHKSTAPCLFG